MNAGGKIVRGGFGPAFSDKTGEIQGVFGPMFSGKSEELIRRIRRYSVHKRVVVLTPSKDTRTVLKIRSHNRTEVPAISGLTVTDCMKNVSLDDVDVVAIDEGQFFSDVVEACEGLANAGKIVVVAALSGSFKRRAFEPPCGNINELLPLCEDVTKLAAICACGKDAHFSKATSDQKEEVKIGGKDAYEAVCRRCYFFSQSKSL